MGDIKSAGQGDKPEVELLDGQKVRSHVTRVRRRLIRLSRRRKKRSVKLSVKTVERDRSRSPLNLTVSPCSRRSTDSAAALATPSPAADFPAAAAPAAAAAAVASSLKARLCDFFSVNETSAGVLEDRTRALCTYYVGLSGIERPVFLRTLAADYGLDRHSVHQGALQVANNLSSRRVASDLVTVRAAERLRQVTVPRYQSLFTQISRLDNGVRFLANLRSDVIGILKSPGVDQDCPHLMTMNTCLHQLLSIWLALGSLQLERITWQTPCDLLQKISAYEAVQPIRNLTELRRRVGPYRRCFCFTHSALPREPLIVVHTALTQNISRTIQSIVGGVSGRGQVIGSDCEEDNNMSNCVEDNKRINTAVFYSITSTQRGLQGVELGGQVIKRVVVDLVSEFPRMSQFASLSPVPGFKDWLLDEINNYNRLREMGEDPQQLLLTSYELAEMSAVFNVPVVVLFSVLRQVLSSDEWIEQPQVVQVLQTPLLRLCARYLYVEKKRGYALNPVANFHLRNGAVLWRLNWLADTSPRGVSVSCTIMANYRYYLEDIDSNSRSYAENQVLAASDQVLDLVRQLPATSQIASSNCQQRDPLPPVIGR